MKEHPKPLGRRVPEELMHTHYPLKPLPMNPEETIKNYPDIPVLDQGREPMSVACASYYMLMMLNKDLKGI